MFGCHCAPLRNPILQFPGGRRQNQFFLRTRQRHVKNTQFLAQRLQFHPAFHHIFLERRSLDALLAVQIVGSDSQIRVDQKFPPRILLVKIFSHSSYKHDRKFQPLALVDAHDPHHRSLGIRHRRLAKICVIFFQFFNIPDKMEHAPVARRLVSSRFLHQHIQVAAPSRPARKRRHIAVIARFVVNPVEEFVHRQVNRFLAECIQESKEFLEFSAQVILLN